MFDPIRVPERISRKVKGLKWASDNVGKSDSTVLIYDEMVLKIEKISRNSKHEILLLDWLDGKFPVPQIIEAETQDDNSFLLMSKVPGDMVCTGNSLLNMEDTVLALVDGLKMMWQIDITSCPCRNTVSDKLIQAKYFIENNLVDIDNFEPETLTTDGFKDVTDLYNYLEQNRPVEDLVFAHGDFSFPNIFVSGRNITGAIDWGNGGIADRWQDISVCYRALRKKYSKYALYSESDYLRYKELFFNKLGFEPNEEKARYFNLMDELF
jgi:kanamycin kinase/aminoglycoside 3'-phosphotransferase-3